MAYEEVADNYAGTKRGRYEAQFAAMKTERSSFDAHYRELSDFFSPRRSRWYPGDRNKGDKRNRNIINSTGRFAYQTLSSGMHSGLTSPARPWMSLTTPNPELNKRGDVRAWLYEVTSRMLAVFELSNLYNVLPTVYGDMALFGTAAMSVLEDDHDLIRCYAYPTGSYVVGLDDRQVAGTFMREYQLSVRQVVEQFALDRRSNTVDFSIVSERTAALWRNGNYEAPIDVVWTVAPNEGYKPDSLSARRFRWTSCYFERGCEQRDRGASTFLRESGFNEFPIMAPRWFITGEDTYGTDCPGMTSLGDNKQLQLEEKQKGRAIAKMIDPPLVGPTSLRASKTSLVPGDVTYVDEREGQKGLRSVHELNINLEHLLLDMGKVEYRIQRAWYEDLFLMLANSPQQGEGIQPITAREVAERHEEKLLALGPVLERTNDELLDPLVDRTYAVMLRRGLIPRAPDALQGVRVKPEYTSIMAAAMRLVQVAALDRFLQTVTPIAQTWPEVREKVDANQVVDNYAMALGVDPAIVRSNDEANARVAQAQQAAAKAQMADNAAKLSQATKNASVPVPPDSPLASIISNVSGAGAGAAALGGGG